jgi:hypothetical protein
LRRSLFKCPLDCYIEPERHAAQLGECRLLAQSGHSAVSDLSPLCTQKRTSFDYLDLWIARQLAAQS